MISMENKPEILYEDNHLLVALKPPGFLSQPGKKNTADMLTYLKEYIKNKYGKPGNVYLGLVHRLDMNVGGVMVFARTSKAASRLSEAIRERNFWKEYLAVVEGKLDTGTRIVLEDNLVKNSVSLKGQISESGKKSNLSYVCLANKKIDEKWISLVRISLGSGRFHQIRVQFSSRNHPIMGDTKYGSQLRIGSNSLSLWAYHLAFLHPVTGEKLSFQSLSSIGGFAYFQDIIVKTGPVDDNIN